MSTSNEYMQWKRRTSRAYAVASLSILMLAGVVISTFVHGQKAQQNMVSQIQQLQWELGETQKSLRESQSAQLQDQQTIRAMQTKLAEKH